MRTRIALPAVLATALATAAVALAAPNHNGTVTVGGPFNWTGGPLSGAAATSDVEEQVPCDAPQQCDQTLLKVDPGQLSVDIKGDDNAVDLDMFVYRSDKDGATGKFVKSSTGSTAEEHTSFEAEAGYYLVKVTPATAAGAMYAGKANELPLPPVPPDQSFGNDPSLPSSGGSGGSDGSSGGGTSGGGTTSGGQATSQADDLAPATTARKPGSRRVRALTGTASDRDGRVAYVDVALARIAGKGCQTLSASGRFVKIKKCTAPHFLRAKGTTAWKLSLKHALKPGRYVVYAQATDNLGRADEGFGSANAKRFTVKK